MTLLYLIGTGVLLWLLNTSTSAGVDSAAKQIYLLSHQLDRTMVEGKIHPERCYQVDADSKFPDDILWLHRMMTAIGAKLEPQAKLCYYDRDILVDRGETRITAFNQKGIASGMKMISNPQGSPFIENLGIMSILGLMAASIFID
jgi:hypothetical protein